jgi:hypothetical protein
VGVVVDPVQDLAHSLLGQGRERLVQRGVEEVRPQPALGPIDGSGPQRAAHGVEHRGTDDAHGQQLDQGRRGVLGEASGEQRAQGGADGSDGTGHECARRDRPPKPPPVDGLVLVVACRGGLRRPLELGGGH